MNQYRNNREKHKNYGIFLHFSSLKKKEKPIIRNEAPKYQRIIFSGCEHKSANAGSPQGAACLKFLKKQTNDTISIKLISITNH